MIREELEQTEWAKEFKKDAPVSYEQGIKYALQEKLEVCLRNNCDIGYWIWSIEVYDEPSFWMGAKETKEEAIELCKQMGWIIVDIGEELFHG